MAGTLDVPYGTDDGWKEGLLMEGLLGQALGPCNANQSSLLGSIIFEMLFMSFPIAYIAFRCLFLCGFLCLIITNCHSKYNITLIL
jgi:hypothetical protein